MLLGVFVGILDVCVCVCLCVCAACASSRDSAMTQKPESSAVPAQIGAFWRRPWGMKGLRKWRNAPDTGAAVTGADDMEPETAGLGLDTDGPGAGSAILPAG